MLGQSLVLILRDLQSKRESLCELAFELKGYSEAGNRYSSQTSLI
jgi:hypothetical protein